MIRYWLGLVKDDDDLEMLDGTGQKGHRPWYIFDSVSEVDSVCASSRSLLSLNL